MKYYLINLDHSPARLAFMRSQFSALEMDVERISAVRGRAVPDWLAQEFENSAMLSDGEVGCYASHLLAAQKIVASGAPCAVVLEDDAILDADFPDACVAAVMRAPLDWDYIHLSSVFKRSVVRVADLSGGRKLVRYSRHPVNTAAYILSNAGARKWLTPISRVRPNDLDIRYAWGAELNVFGVYPSPSQQDHVVPSTIDHGDKRVKDWSPGFGAELYGEWWTARQIGVATYARARALNIWNSVRRKADGERHVALLRSGPTRA